MESSQHGMMRFNELEQQFAHFSETVIENKISFLQMLQCIEPNQILQIQTLEPENSLTLETTKPDPVQTNNPETITGTVPLKESTVVVKERKKRKRTRTPKNKDKVENQRMTHIAVERNRRRQMNEHLNSLKSLMPSSYLQRGDQASIVAGAIDFIKELEQLLFSLEGEKRHEVCNENTKTGSSSSSSSFACTTSSVSSISTASEDGFTARSGSEKTAEVKATVIQNHVNLKVRCRRRQGQILKAIVAIEDMKLTVLHLTISPSFHFGFYSFNLKIEDGCKVRTADEIATNVHLIFNQINGDLI